MPFIEVKFKSAVLGPTMAMNVIIPQKPNSNTGTYPTLYLLHGMSDDHTTWSRRTSIERYADEHGIAVVMPTTNLGWYTDMKYGHKYRTFIGEEIPKLCRTFFPGMSAKREDNYIAGNSMGGYGALAIALTYPETFSIAAPLSGGFEPKGLYKPEQADNHYFTDIFGNIDEFDGSKNDLYHLSKVRKEDGSSPVSVCMICGTEDGHIEQSRRMSAHLSNLGYDLTYSEKTGGHNWKFWDEEIQNVLNYIDEKRKGVN